MAKSKIEIPDNMKAGLEFNAPVLMNVPVKINGVDYPFEVGKPGQSFNSAMAAFEEHAQDAGGELEKQHKRGVTLGNKIALREKSLNRKTAKPEKEVLELVRLKGEHALIVSKTEQYNAKALELGKNIVRVMCAKPDQVSAIFKAYDWKLADIVALIGGVTNELHAHFVEDANGNVLKKKTRTAKGKRRS